MSAKKEFDVYGVGNAIVDVLTFVGDDFVEQVGFPKGSMNLVDTPKRTEILTALGQSELQKQGGGSAANSMIGIVQSGGSGIFIGKVADDEDGRFYANDLKKNGLQYPVSAASSEGEPTGTSIILTTPDAERTMCTHLGVSVGLDEGDISADDVAKCKVCYVEGYLWTGPGTKAAALKAMELAKDSGGKVSFTFSDSFLVGLFSDDFKVLVKDLCDIVFCNADEVRSFIGNDDLDVCADSLGKMVDQAFITDGKDGAIVVDKGQVSRVPGFVVKAIDTVGAGDAFAGGVLYGLTNGLCAADAAKWGNYLASEVVTVQGPRVNPAQLKTVSEILGN